MTFQEQLLSQTDLKFDAATGDGGAHEQAGIRGVHARAAAAILQQRDCIPAGQQVCSEPLIPLPVFPFNA